ncbi:RDD family protein [Streptosporangium sp. NPDC048047]|uniref:RDD family protein n=1 Tax=Streptosporangium sp. NPDC048047 TaxID=3155748 RepID=UPI0034497B50
MSSTAPAGSEDRAPAGRRIVAWLIDWLCVLVLPLLLVPVGVAAGGMGLRLPAWGWNVVSFLILIVPVTVWAARRESGPLQATPGKRRMGLAVADARSGRPVGFGPALLRNILKIAVPWELGHTVAFAFVSQAGGEVPGPVVALTVVTYAVMFCWLGSLFLPSARTPYDLAGGTRVVRRTP